LGLLWLVDWLGAQSSTYAARGFDKRGEGGTCPASRT
jgi:hypothetical protein